MAKAKRVVLTGPNFATRFLFPGEAVLAEQVEAAQRMRVIPVEPGPELGSRWEWPGWMRQQQHCEACGWQGPFEARERCWGFQRSHYMRS
jgi:hypothetical protein